MEGEGHHVISLVQRQLRSKVFENFRFSPSA